MFLSIHECCENTMMPCRKLELMKIFSTYNKSTQLKEILHFLEKRCIWAWWLTFVSEMQHGIWSPLLCECHFMSSGGELTPRHLAPCHLSHLLSHPFTKMAFAPDEKVGSQPRRCCWTCPQSQSVSVWSDVHLTVTGRCTIELPFCFIHFPLLLELMRDLKMKWKCISQ